VREAPRPNYKIPSPGLRVGAGAINSEEAATPTSLPTGGGGRLPFACELLRFGYLCGCHLERDSIASFYIFGANAHAVADTFRSVSLAAMLEHAGRAQSTKD
jgi:hypothetical protein